MGNMVATAYQEGCKDRQKGCVERVSMPDDVKAKVYHRSTVGPRKRSVNTLPPVAPSTVSMEMAALQS